MPISFGSINTGLPKDIVQQIMASEKIPVQKMEVRKGKVNAKVELVSELTKLVEELKGDLLAIASPKDLQEFKVETNNDIVDVMVDKTKASASITQMEVLSLAQKSSAMTNGVADKDNTYFGVGFIQYTLPDGTEKDIYIDKDHSSLTGIARLINNDPSNGMKANVVNDGKTPDAPWRLLINLEETGDQNNAEFPYFYLIDGYEDLYLDNERSAHDARYKVNGFELESPQNSVKELLPGVTVDFKKARPGEEFSIKITEDIKAVTDKIKDLVEKINAVLKFIKDQNSLDESTDTSRTLGGDITLQSLENRLRTVIFSGISTQHPIKRVGDIGVTFQKTGQLKFDEDKFKSAISKNYRAVVEVLVGLKNSNGSLIKGFNTKLADLINQVLRHPDGLLKSRKKGLQNRIKQIDRQIEQRERMLVQKEAQLKNKFARLEETISKIKGSGAGLSALGAGMPAQPQL